MAHRSYNCSYCEQTFPSPQAHLQHLGEAHASIIQKAGRLPRDKQLRRSSFCRSCASEIAVGERLCSCGAISPAFRSQP
jgi:hypothetical protein